MLDKRFGIRFSNLSYSAHLKITRVREFVGMATNTKADITVNTGNKFIS